MSRKILASGERWKKFQRGVLRGDANYGLTQQQRTVLMESSDTEFDVRVAMPSGLYEIKAQETRDEATARQLQEIGLIEIMGARKGAEPTSIIWKFTPEGIALAHRFLKEE